MKKVERAAGVAAAMAWGFAVGPAVLAQEEPVAAAPYDSTVPVADPAAEGAPNAAAPAEVPAAFGEVVVTARRKAENIQDVPIAISAMSADDLQREQINSPQDLQGRVPSLVVGTNSQMRNTESPAIRGQGAQFGAAPGVIIYMAEVPLASDPVANYQGGPGKFFDLSNVQILKGSQGTLFGRNTTGGALLLEPRRPENEFSGSLKAGGTSFDGRTFEGIVNVPLVDDVLLLRTGGQWLERDGFTHDVVTGKDYDSKQYWAARAGLLWRPSGTVDNYLLANYGRSSDNGTATVIDRINREGLNQAIPAAIGLSVLSQIPGLDLTQTANLGCQVLNVFGPSTNCGQDILDEQAARDPRHVQLSGDPDDQIKSGSVVDHFNVHLSDDVTLRNIASLSRFRHHYRWDLDGSRAELNEFNSPDDVDTAFIRTWTEELQLQGKALDGSLSYAVGGYYERTKARGAINATSLMIAEVYQEYGQKKRSYAPFAQGTYNLGGLSDTLDGLSLTLGARYTWDKTTGNALLQQRIIGLFSTVDEAHDAGVKDSAPTYTAGLDYKFGAHLVYGKVSRGYKTGGISVIVVNPAHYTYDPEFVTNYEVGQKSDFEIAGMPVRVNTSVYYTDYTDLQTAGPDSYIPPNSVNPIPQLGQAIFNVGKAWVAGFEFDGTIQPTPEFTFIATYGYTHAEYEKFDLLYGGATPQLDCSGEQRYRDSTLELSCLPYHGTPKHQFSVSGRYLMPLDPSNGDLEGALTYAWTGKNYSAQTTLPEDEPGAWLPSYGLLNGSLSWTRVLGTAFDVQLFGTNLTGKRYRISNSNQWHLTYFSSSIWSEPRIVGVNVTYRWGT